CIIRRCKTKPPSGNIRQKLLTDSRGPWISCYGPPKRPKRLATLCCRRHDESARCPMHADTYLTPPAIAQRLGVSPETVIGWIRSGELEAINVAQRGKSRPRYRVSPQSLADWELRRSVVTSVSPIRRPRRDPAIKSYV
ncbi:MAG: helix-turn-helix domain-containing protein, partial [Planctomycetaceae bacterium]